VFGTIILVILVFAFVLVQTLVSLWILRKAQAKARERLRANMEARTISSIPRTQMPLDQHYVEGVGYLIGDISCQFNARSPYIRCAVNPQGPCDECPYYQPKDFE
jgi:hypothetical protein